MTFVSFFPHSETFSGSPPLRGLNSSYACLTDISSLSASLSTPIRISQLSGCTSISSFILCLPSAVVVLSLPADTSQSVLPCLVHMSLS